MQTLKAGPRLMKTETLGFSQEIYVMLKPSRWF